MNLRMFALIDKRSQIILRHSGTRPLARASDAQLRIGESILTIVALDSGLDAARRPGMTGANKNPGIAAGVLHFLRNALRGWT
jgi:hypothetical protein